MGDTRDLKSLGQKCPCEFESHLGYQRKTITLVVIELINIVKLNYLKVIVFLFKLLK